MQHLGDVSKINGAQIVPVDIITFGSPCFPAGTLALTNHGYTPIEDILVGDKVFTHMGNWKRVSVVGNKKSDVIVLKGHHYGIITTPEHPFYSAEQKNEWNGNGYTRVLDNIGIWKPAKDMEGLRWAVPNKVEGLQIPPIINNSNKQNKPPKIDVNLMYVIGRWLGDGWVRNGQRHNRPCGEMCGQIFVCANKDKTEYLKKRLLDVFNDVSKVNMLKERTVNKFYICNQALCEWICNNFGKMAHGKTLPSWVYCMPQEMRQSLLDGYTDSDGYVLDNNIKLTTVSKNLAHSIRLLGETLGYSCTVHYAKMPDKTNIEGRCVNQRDQYQVVLCKSKRKNVISEGLYNWYSCKSVEKIEGIQTVYNITVEDDHSYIVEGFVVHNCQDMSVAGKRTGMKHEEQGDDETTRSGLFYEAIRIIKEMRKATNGEYPKYAVWENVPGAFSSNKGWDFHAVLEAFCSIKDYAISIPEPYDTKRTKLVWDKAGEIVGDNYSVAWRTLDAQYWGVPQRRKRIYLVADFRSQCAREILFKPDSLRRDLPQGDEKGQGSSSNVMGGTDGSPDAYGIDGYNFAITGDKAATVGVNCGVSTGRNGVIENVNNREEVECYGIDHVITTGANCTAQGSCVYEYTQATLKAGGVHAVAYSFDSLSSNSMKSSNPISGCRSVDIAKCIDTTYPDPSKNQGGIAVVDLNDQGGSSINAESEDLSPTLRANSHQHEPVIALQANGIGRADTTGCDGCGWMFDESYTLNTVDRHAVVFVDAFNQTTGDISKTLNIGSDYDHTGCVCFEPCAMVRDMGNRVWDEQSPTLRANMGDNQPTVCFEKHQTVLFEPRSPDGEPRIYDKICPTLNTAQGGQRQPCIVTDCTASGKQYFGTLQASCAEKQWLGNQEALSGDYHIVQEARPPRKYIIRRLTPTECARLQGFPDKWGHLAPYNSADAEFWEDVRKTHAEINGKTYKPTKNLKKWYEGLHTDSAVYKLWGNGIALPNAEYVIHEIAEQGAKTLGSLFDGSGGFPLSGVMNGIKPIWASEVEPYAVAVTVSRFGRN